jgi:hypothetical protein
MTNKQLAWTITSVATGILVLLVCFWQVAVLVGFCIGLLFAVGVLAGEVPGDPSP